VLGLICCGTLFEIYLRRKLKEALRRQDKEMMNNSETSSGIGCASSDYSDTMTAHDDPLKQSDHSQSSNSLKQLDALVLNLPPNDNDSGNGHHHDHDAEHDHHDHHRSGSNNSNSDEHLEGHLHEPEKLSIYSELLLSFSAITNFNAICDRNVGADTIPCIHGLRAFSMAWVILGVVQVTMKYLATYSIFDPPTMDHITCPDYWWRNILYINTLFPVDEMVSVIQHSC